MQTIKLGIISLILVFALGVILSISNVVEQTGETVREWSPEKMVQATATAQAIPLINEPTRTWIDNIVPTQQAVESAEIIETTKQRYENDRLINNALSDFATGALNVARIGVSINIIVLLLGFAIVIGCLVIKQVKNTIDHEPVQILPMKPLYFPQRKMLTHPLTGMTWEIVTQHAASIEHGQLLIEAQTGAKSVRYRFTPRNGERHPETIIDAKLLT